MILNYQYVEWNLYLSKLDMMKIKFLLLFVLFPCVSYSDTVLGLYAGAEYWNFDLSGTIKTSGSPVQLNTNNQNGIVFNAAIEHPIPFLPNLGIRSSKINSNQTNSYNYNGQNIQLYSEIDLSHADITLYYELLDNWVNLDLGLNLKKFDGYNYLYSANNINQKNSIKSWIPMGYAKGQFNLPFSGLSASATLETLSIKNSKATDFDISLLYETDSGLGAKLGYRDLNVDLSDSEDFNTEISSKGLYLGVNFHF